MTIKKNPSVVVLFPIALASVVAIVMFFFSVPGNFQDNFYRLSKIAQFERSINAIYFEESGLDRVFYELADNKKLDDLSMHLNNRRLTSKNFNLLKSLHNDDELHRLMLELLEVKIQKDMLERDIFSKLKLNNQYQISIDYAVFSIQSDQFYALIEKLRSRILEIVEEQTAQNENYVNWSSNMGLFLSFVSCSLFVLFIMLFCWLIRSKQELYTEIEKYQDDDNKLENTYSEKYVKHQQKLLLNTTSASETEA